MDSEINPLILRDVSSVSLREDLYWNTEARDILWLLWSSDLNLSKTGGTI